MRLLITLLALCFGVAATATVRAAELPAIGSTAKESITVDGVEVPLPTGEWIVYFTRARPGGNYPRSDVGLARIRDRLVHQTIYITVARARRGDGFRPYGGCEQPYYTHVVVDRNRHSSDQDCHHVRVIDLSAGEQPSENMRALFAFADGRKLFLPVAMIGVRYHLADRKLLLRVSYGWNPDLILPASGKRKLWVFEDWTKAAVEKDPRRKAVMDTMAKWGEDWLPQVRNAFLNAPRKAEE